MPFCRCPGLHDWLLKAYRRNKIPEAHHFPPFSVSTLLAKKWSLWNSLLPARPRQKDDLAGTCLSCQFLKCPNYCDVGIEKANLPLLMGKRTGNEVGVWTSGKKAPLQDKTLVTRLGLPSELRGCHVAEVWMLARDGHISCQGLNYVLKV